VNHRLRVHCGPAASKARTVIIRRRPEFSDEATATTEDSKSWKIAVWRRKSWSRGSGGPLPSFPTPTCDTLQSSSSGKSPNRSERRTHRTRQAPPPNRKTWDGTPIAGAGRSAVVLSSRANEAPRPRISFTKSFAVETLEEMHSKVKQTIAPAVGWRENGGRYGVVA
jgi:hypothetical protein